MAATYRSLMITSTLLTCCLLTAGCGDTVRPGKDLQVANATDTFQFQVTDMENYSKVLQYSWANTGTAANVNQACAIRGGSATLTIRDAAGTQVYSRTLKDNGTFLSATGITGTWTIRLDLSKTTGTLNFRVQKAP